MKFGMMFANTGPFVTAAGAVELAREAELAGFESLWAVEHVIWPAEYSSRYPYSPSGKMPGDSSSPIPDPLIWLSFAAASTSTIRLATGILILPERNPLILAKEAATLHVLSDGRFDLGIGVGWLEEEFAALGVPFERRGDRADDYLAAMRSLWSDDPAAHDGEFVSFQDVSSNPKPLGGAVPVIVGGHSRAAARRAGRLGDGFFPAQGSMAELAELFDVARQTAADTGRDPEALELTAGHPGLLGEDPVAAAEELAALGVSRSVLPAFLLARGSVAGGAEALAERVIRPCASV